MAPRRRPAPKRRVANLARRSRLASARSFAWWPAVFAIAIGSAVFTSHGSYVSPQAFVDGFGPALAVAAGLAVVAAIAGSFLPGRRQATELIGGPTPIPAFETE